MVGHRRDPVGAGLEDLHRARLGVGPLALADDRAHAVAGNGAGDEHHVAVDARHAGAAEGERVDRQLELVAALGPGWVGGAVDIATTQLAGGERCHGRVRRARAPRRARVSTGAA